MRRGKGAEGVPVAFRVPVSSLPPPLYFLFYPDIFSFLILLLFCLYLFAVVVVIIIRPCWTIVTNDDDDAGD